MLFQHPVSNNCLVQDVIEHQHRIEYSVHGLSHWQKVERNGLYLGSQLKADLEVISLFALFHDSQRINDFEDPQHGKRGAALAEKFYRKGLLSINSAQQDLLIYACEYHTDQTHSDNITIQSCWDADRLDLTRVGVLPDPKMLNTKAAKIIAETMDYSSIESFQHQSSTIKNSS